MFGQFRRSQWRFNRQITKHFFRKRNRFLPEYTAIWSEETYVKNWGKAARQATVYVNLCCKIANLQSFVLWEAFCIMNRSALYQPGTRVVLDMINRSQISNLNMLKCITEPEIQNAVFLSVFNITENEKVRHFLQI